MKAWRISKHGGLEVLEQESVADKPLQSSRVRVRVECVGLNHLDLWVRKGVHGHRFPLPITPGCDVTGVIESFGATDLSHGYTVGDPVIVNPGLSCGHCEACLGGFDPLCRNYGILGETCDGGCAEFVDVPIANLIARPPELSAEEGAALPIPFLTAWTMLFGKTQLKPGEICLIHAGGSGVSVAAIQIAKMIGATVITTVGDSAKAMRAQALGADHTIEYRKKPFREALKEILPKYGKKGCDVILDHVGQDTFSESLKSLAWGGRIATCGATSGAEVLIDLKPIFFKNISIFGTTMGSKADLIKIVRLVQLKRLRPVIDSIFSIDNLPDAHLRLESREAFGKVILKR